MGLLAIGALTRRALRNRYSLVGSSVQRFSGWQLLLGNIGLALHGGISYCSLTGQAVATYRILGFRWHRIAGHSLGLSISL